MSRAGFLPKPPARQQLDTGRAWSHNCFIIAQLRGCEIAVFNATASYDEQSLIEIDGPANAAEVMVRSLWDSSELPL